jgi:hypothetical protein
MVLKDYKQLLVEYKDYLIEFEGTEGVVKEHDESLDAMKIILSKTKNFDRYMVSGYEGLSFAVASLLTSEYGYYIMGYLHKFGVNRFVTGFRSASELLHYANWVVEQYNESFDDAVKEIEELKKIETEMSNEQRKEKYLAQREAQIKIYQHIFDFEAKKQYCEEAEKLSTIHDVLDGFTKVSKVIKVIYDELVKVPSESNNYIHNGFGRVCNEKNN